MTDTIESLRAERDDAREDVRRMTIEAHALEDLVEETQRQLKEALAQAEPAALHEAALAVHGALGWGFDPNTVSPVMLARAATALANEHRRPDGRECACLAEVICEKCGWVAKPAPTSEACATCGGDGEVGDEASDVWKPCPDCRGGR